MRRRINWIHIAVGAATALALGGLSTVARAHCDTLDGPVVKAAKLALERGDVTPVLKWVKQENEAEVREAFAHTLKVRAAGPEARALADRYFFETLVRLHRAGEGAPYTGLKAAGTDPGPAVRGADRALEEGSDEALVKLLSDELAAGVRARFAHALEGKKKAEESVEAGRDFVAAYVEFVHYAERVHSAVSSAATSHDTGAQAEAGSLHRE